MTLKIEDCKIGAEIICINNKVRNIQVINKAYSEWIKVGSVYTIRQFKYSSYPRKGVPVILVNEIQGWKDHDGLEASLDIWRFKLLDPKDIQIFYDLISKPNCEKVLELT